MDTRLLPRLVGIYLHRLFARLDFLNSSQPTPTGDGSLMLASQREHEAAALTDDVYVPD